MKKTIGYVLVTLALAGLTAPLSEAAGARKMFEQYKTGATRSFSGTRNLVPDFANQPVGFGIQLEVEKQNKSGSGWRQVSYEDHVFRDNDRVRFKLTTNGSCYLMLLNNGNLIWPVRKDRNLIPDMEFQHPGDREIVIGPFRVAPPAKPEENVLVLSPRPFSQQADIVSTPLSQNPPPAPTILDDVEMNDIASIEDQLRSSDRAVRNLIYETEDNATYVVSDDADPVKPMRHPFTLLHK